MATNRKLIDYLPAYMREYEEIATLTHAEQPEVDKLWTATENALADQFIVDATEYGISRWETILKVLPKATDTLDERKFRIITLLNQQLPYTVRSMEQMLIQLCGADGYSVELNANDYHLKVKIALGNHSNYGEVEKMLSTMIPANLTCVVELMFNKYEKIAQFTHDQLTALTHYQMRNEVLT